VDVGDLPQRRARLFQAAKSLDSDERAAIRAVEHPKEAKRRGREVTLRPGWDRVKTAVMEVLLREPRPGAASSAPGNRDRPPDRRQPLGRHLLGCQPSHEHRHELARQAALPGAGSHPPRDERFPGVTPTSAEPCRVHGDRALRLPRRLPLDDREREPTAASGRKPTQPGHPGSLWSGQARRWKHWRPPARLVQGPHPMRTEHTTADSRLGPLL
jgi:hypothetical protein